jgi:hypothetical protein
MAKFIYIENEGALFRGRSRAWPSEVWSPTEKKFVAYTGDVPKGVEWGDIIDEAEAQRMMGND